MGILIDALIVIFLVLAIANVFLMNPLLFIICSIIPPFLLLFIRIMIPNGFKILDAKLSGKFCPIIVNEARKAYPLPCKIDSGAAVLDSKLNAKVPIDWNAVVSYDGVPVMFLYRGVGKALNFELISFFDWLEEEYGIDPNDFKAIMKLAIERGRKIRNLDEFFEFQNELLNEAADIEGFGEVDLNGENVRKIKENK